MFEIFTAKVPVTYTEYKKQGNIVVEETIDVGYLYTPNLLASMQEHKRIVEELIKE